jgi:hypothetical protein
MADESNESKTIEAQVVAWANSAMRQAEKEQTIGAVPPTTLGGDEAIKAFHQKIDNGEEPVKAFDEALSAYDKKIWAEIKLQDEKAGSKLGSAATEISGHETIKPLETPPTSKTREATPAR